jgi:hypothetical protein
MASELLYCDTKQEFLSILVLQDTVFSVSWVRLLTRCPPYNGNRILTAIIINKTPPLGLLALILSLSIPAARCNQQDHTLTIMVYQ